MKRRNFLILTAGFTIGAASLTSCSKQWPAVVIQPEKHSPLTEKQWQTMDSVLNHCFPSEPDAPGAKEIYATAWLYNALSMPDVDQSHQDLMRKGVVRVEKTSQVTYQKSFTHLAEEQRETILRLVEKNREGNAWLRETLRYILEALLIDPVYGSNPDAVGWKWLKHRPGFPRPPADKRYFLL